MPLERGVHPLVQPPELGRILADQVRAELGDPGPDPGRIRGEIERPERTDLAVADDAGVGLDAHDRAVEDR